MSPEEAERRHADGHYQLAPVAENTTAWNSYHEIARTSLFKNNKSEYYTALKILDSYYAKMTPLLLSFNGEAMGTVALDELGDGRAAMRMVAVEKSHHGRGHGRALGSLLMEFARSHGIKRLCVNAGSDAVGYYTSLGFTPETWSRDEYESFRESGVMPVQMVRDIS
jgi:ribosomal protein S18 acetylase RimI-like enzyme